MVREGLPEEGIGGRERASPATNGRKGGTERKQEDQGAASIWVAQGEAGKEDHLDKQFALHFCKQPASLSEILPIRVFLF